MLRTLVEQGPPTTAITMATPVAITGSRSAALMC